MKTVSGEIIRPIQRVYPLEIDANEQNNEMSSDTEYKVEINKFLKSRQSSGRDRLNSHLGFWTSKCM